MDARKREQQINKDLQLAHSKLNHLTVLVGDVSKEIKKCQQLIDTANEKLKELHNEHGKS